MKNSESRAMKEAVLLDVTSSVNKGAGPWGETSQFCSWQAITEVNHSNRGGQQVTTDSLSWRHLYQEEVGVEGSTRGLQKDSWTRDKGHVGTSLEF